MVHSFVQSLHAGVGILIRPATPADADMIIGSINAICAEGNAFYTTRFVASQQWEAALYQPEQVPDHLLVVAELDGSFAGAGHLFPGPEHTLYRHVGEAGLWVLKPYRRQGIGRQLMDWMLSWAVQSGLEKVILNVFATNRAALALYTELGFVEEGRRVRQFKVEDGYADEILMACFLRPSMDWLVSGQT